MSSKYRIVVDENMPGVDRLFGDIADIVRVNGRQISNQILQNADALLCRSITQVNQSLLEDSQVQFVGTATIGIDHLDTKWLDNNQISWSNAAGCNAAAVAQYVLSAMSFWCLHRHKALKNLTVGIVGAGNVGSELSHCLNALGVNNILCDPPLEEAGDARSFVELSEVLKCDVVTLHTPITKSGPHKTYHLLDTERLDQLNSEQLLINASRGAVINNEALLSYLERPESAQAVIDVFENEPNISQSLLSKCLLGTPHIAGHTLEGKLRGSWMIYKAFCKHFAEPLNKQEQVLYPELNQLKEHDNQLKRNLLRVYDIELDSMALKQIEPESIGEQFDQLRKNATVLSNGVVRRDYAGWQLPAQLKSLANPQ